MEQLSTVDGDVRSIGRCRIVDGAGAIAIEGLQIDHGEIARVQPRFIQEFNAYGEHHQLPAYQRTKSRTPALAYQ